MMDFRAITRKYYIELCTHQILRNESQTESQEDGRRAISNQFDALWRHGGAQGIGERTPKVNYPVLGLIESIHLLEGGV